MHDAGLTGVRQKAHVELTRCVAECGDLVSVRRMSEQSAVVVPFQFLASQPAHALHETSLDLTTIDTFIDGVTDIVKDVHPPYRRHASEAVHLHLAYRGTTREIVEGLTASRRAIPVDVRR